MGNKPLSERQQAMLEFIQNFVAENGYPPTIREIGEACAIPSTSVVNYNLNRLQREGYLTREDKVSRGIRLTNAYQDTISSVGLVRVPVLGRIVASEPVPVPGSDFSLFGDDTLELTRDIVKDDEELFALQVQGDSMRDAMISDGDYVILKPQPSPNNGEMVAVWLSDKEETTLKRFFREDGKIRLQPENSEMKPIIVDDPSTVEIQGRVVAVVRHVN